MAKRILIPIAHGIEEIEAVSIIDTLRRANLDVMVASVQDTLQITASRGVKITADALLTDCTGQTFDMIALPGGMPGATHLAQCDPLITMLKQQAQAGLWYAAICAAPAVVLQPNGLLKGIKATCYPAMLDQLESAYASRDGVVIDRPCVTGQGPGFALEFSLALVEVLAGVQERQAIAKAMLVE
ncbi:MAG: DJ-1/PfpI family protein [Phycisphaerae bacterium]|nr:DJ-1/PfpI family protein [Phycisphaerae bacterium]